MNYTKFEDLPIWKLSLEITKILYDLTSLGDWSKDWALKDQARRSVISISSNIVEGFEKNNNNEFIRYLKIAKGSTGELRNQLYIAFAIKYITNEQFERINGQLIEISKQIGGLIKYLENLREAKKFAIRNSKSSNQ